MDKKYDLIPTGPATSKLEVEGYPPITVIGNETIKATFDHSTLSQIINIRYCPGVSEVVLNPDAHVGYGAPIGCVMVSPDRIYPAPVGVDVKCSMSLIQFDLPAEEILDKRVRRQLINAICNRIPTGFGRGERKVPLAHYIPPSLALKAICEGASQEVCEALNIPFEWTLRCEDAHHEAHDGTNEMLALRYDQIKTTDITARLPDKLSQLGSYGGGNHFGEGEITHVDREEQAQKCAEIFGLIDGHVSFLSHCGSRGFGNILATNQFRILKRKFEKDNIPFPGGDRYLVYAETGSPEADDYLDDMALAANFATVNHLLINVLVKEAFEEIFPEIKVSFVYLISHNIARWEPLDGRTVLVHRKGATRAFPAGHSALVGTPFERTGHPILLPGNPLGGSSVMVALPGARKTCYSVNHGAGRTLGRSSAIKQLNQKAIDAEMDSADILFNCRCYPKDEAPAAYKNFNEVKKSVIEAGLAMNVARLQAKFVIKDGDKPDD